MTLTLFVRLLLKNTVFVFFSIVGISRYLLSMLTKKDYGYQRLTIVFLTEKARSHFRLLRFAKGLKKNSPIQIILFSMDVKKDSDLNPEYRNCFSEIIYYSSLWHLKSVLNKKFRTTRIPFHVFTPPNNIAKAVIRHTSNPVFFDPYDVRVIYFGPFGEGCDIPWMKKKWIKKDVPDERYCFEYAAAHICRSAENKTAIRKFNYKTKAPRLFMPDYCDAENFIQPVSRVLGRDQDIHIVYVGGVSSINAPRSFYQYMQLHNTIKSITRQSIHFHIYYSPTQNDDLSDYARLADENPYFHWHVPVPQKQMIMEIARFHFGIIPFFKEEMGNISPDKFFASTSLKLFNYLEAGLPVIISRDLGHKSQIIRKYNIGFAVCRDDLNNLKNLILESDYTAIVQDVIKGREILSLQKNINRLSNFYFKNSTG